MPSPLSPPTASSLRNPQYQSSIIPITNWCSFDCLYRTHVMIKFLEFDKTMTENVILLGERKSGFVPPHYAALINFLGRMYTIAGQKEKAEEQIEPFRKAVYMLYDDAWQNEMSIADFKINIYSSFDDSEKMKEAIIEHRNFVIQYSKDTGEDFSEQINRMNALIKQLEMASAE